MGFMVLVTHELKICCVLVNCFNIKINILQFSTKMWKSCGKPVKCVEFLWSQHVCTHLSSFHRHYRNWHKSAFLIELGVFHSFCDFCGKREKREISDILDKTPSFCQNNSVKVDRYTIGSLETVGVLYSKVTTSRGIGVVSSYQRFQEDYTTTILLNGTGPKSQKENVFTSWQI